MDTKPVHHRYSTWGASRGNRLPAPLYPPGTPAHVTICTWKDQEIFRSPRCARPVFRLCARHPQTLACCLMPDHLHWLIRDAATMRRVVGQLKSSTTRALWELGHPGRLWQRSFWDHVVRREESLEAIARYIVNNPVRKGLVRDAREYPWSMIQLRDPLPGSEAGWP